MVEQFFLQENRLSQKTKDVINTQGYGWLI